MRNYYIPLDTTFIGRNGWQEFQLWLNDSPNDLHPGKYLLVSPSIFGGWGIVNDGNNKQKLVESA